MMIKGSLYLASSHVKAVFGRRKTKSSQNQSLKWRFLVRPFYQNWYMVGNVRHSIWTLLRSKGRSSKNQRSRSHDLVAEKNIDIVRKRHLVVELHPSYMKSRSPGSKDGVKFLTRSS